MGRYTRIIALVLSAAVLSLAPTSAAPTQAGTPQTYVVVFNGQTVPADAGKLITTAGGVTVYSYDQIGVVIARSDSAAFTSLLTDRRIKGVSSTAGFATALRADTTVAGSEGPTTVIPATDSDSLSGLQWDMAQIGTPAAHAINGGSPSITVGAIDTGLDYTHPDLAPNVDYVNSVSCITGAPVSDPSAWNDDNGHGTHIAGTIAAASNGIGIVGVAPNVKIAGIKAGNASGFFFPEAVVCAFMWAGTQHIPVLNNSYFADPWQFNCRSDAAQRAIWEAERRAIQFAQRNGAVVVAALGNQADDLTHPTQDATSPDDSTPLLRQIRNDCAVIPVEVPGVIGVAADGNLQLKSFYSSYGLGVTELTAPGGDSTLQRTTAAPNGRVLSTWPAALLTATCLATRRVVDASGATYCYQQGTSMAAPHVAGVAALIMSRGITIPNAVAATLYATADPLTCPPDISIYSPFPAVDNGAPQVCVGGTAHNSFNGFGQVNALRAVAP